MIAKLNLKDIETVKSVIELQKASYKVEAEIIRFYEIPLLKDTIASLNLCDEIFYGYYINGVLVGIISYKVINKVLDIHRVAIHPLYFRRGIAIKLISYIEELENSIERVKVCTGKVNLPAVSLYLKNGFKKIKDIEICKGFYVTQFEKEV